MSGRFSLNGAKKSQTLVFTLWPADLFTALGYFISCANWKFWSSPNISPSEYLYERPIRLLSNLNTAGVSI